LCEVDEGLLRLRVAKARVGRLATVSAAGEPHLVPVCFVLAGDVLYWAVDQKPKSSRDLKRIQNLTANPVAELLVDHYEEDWRRLWWVRVSCAAEVLEGGPESEQALDLLAAKYAQYRERRPQGPVVRLRARRWSAWSGDGVDP
jgi:PPOX class probable F420-dependent enzyme